MLSKKKEEKGKVVGSTQPPDFHFEPEYEEIMNKILECAPFQPLEMNVSYKAPSENDENFKKSSQEVRSGNVRFFIIQQIPDESSLIPRKYEVFFDFGRVQFIEFREIRDSSVYAKINLVSDELKNCVGYCGKTEIRIEKDQSQWSLIGLGHSYAFRDPILFDVAIESGDEDAIKYLKSHFYARDKLSNSSKEERSKLYFPVDLYTFFLFVSTFRQIQKSFPEHYSKKVLSHEFVEEEVESEEGEEGEDDGEEEKTEPMMKPPPIYLSFCTTNDNGFNRPPNYETILRRIFGSDTKIPFYYGLEYVRIRKKEKMRKFVSSDHIDQVFKSYVKFEADDLFIVAKACINPSAGKNGHIVFLDSEEHEKDKKLYRSREDDYDIKMLMMGERIVSAVKGSEQRLRMEITNAKTELTDTIGSLDVKLMHRMDGIQKEMKKMNQKLDSFLRRFGDIHFQKKHVDL